LTSDNIIYRDRKTGHLLTEKLLFSRLQKAMAKSALVRFFLDLFLNTPFFCWFIGKWQDRSASRQNIESFVKKHNINTREIEFPLSQYKNFNDFFSRKLKQGMRPFEPDPNVFCAPSDGKVMVYAQLEQRTRLPIKGSYIDIVSLLTSETRAYSYHGGSALVVRLAPYDYHRFHFPVSGTAPETQSIGGRYYPVNPLALVLKPDLFVHNKRAVTFFNTELFGKIAYIEVSGFAVGRLIQTYQPGPVKRGQEKGYFQFGGSTLVLLFEPDVILFDDDLIQHTADGMEVQVQAGTRIGIRR
jgi:phosphatidylserine decarboxylase